MKFSELENIMLSQGITRLASIARNLGATPQAVSNWKARGVVPSHIAEKLNKRIHIDKPVLSIAEEDNTSLSNILLTIAEQLKVVVLTIFICVFSMFTYLKTIQEPLYESSSTFLLPEKNSSLNTLQGLASQFGVVSPQQASELDLSSPSFIPQLIESRTFAERILEKKFYTDLYKKDLSLIAILTFGNGSPELDGEFLTHRAVEIFQGMVSIKEDKLFSKLTIVAKEALFAKELNKIVLQELQNINKYYKNISVNEKIKFIQNRIKSVETELESSEKTLKSFREKNRQISSPALQLEQERFTREVEIQKGIFLTLKQQLELAKIEEVQRTSVLQILDEPQIPLYPSNQNLKTSLLISIFMGIVLGILFGFIRAYTDNADIDERKKIRRTKYLIKKKTKDMILDFRFSGIISLILFIGLPIYLTHQSVYPYNIYFDMYSKKLLLFNIAYVLFFIIIFGLSVYAFRNQKINKKTKKQNLI